MTTNQTVHDPVCHMDIDIKEAAGRSDYNGLTFYFCSPGCKQDFDGDPEGVLKAEGEYDHSQPAEPMMGGAGSSSGAQAMSDEPKKPWWQFWK